MILSPLSEGENGESEGRIVNRFIGRVMNIWRGTSGRAGGFLPLNELFKSVAALHVEDLDLPENVKIPYKTRIDDLIDASFRRDTLTGIHPRTYQDLTRDLCEFYACTRKNCYAYALAGDVSNLGMMAEKLGPEITSLFLHRVNEIIAEELINVGAVFIRGMNTFGTDEIHNTVLITAKKFANPENTKDPESAEGKLEAARAASVGRIIELVDDLGLDRLTHPKHAKDPSYSGVSFAFAFAQLSGKHSRAELDQIALEKWIASNKEGLRDRKRRELTRGGEKTGIAALGDITTPFSDADLTDASVTAWIKKRLQDHHIKHFHKPSEHPFFDVQLRLEKTAENDFPDFHKHRCERAGRCADALLADCDNSEKRKLARRYMIQLYTQLYHAKDLETGLDLPTHKSDRSWDIINLGAPEGHMLRFSPSNFSGCNAILPNSGTNYIFQHICAIIREEFEKEGVAYIGYRTGGRDAMVLVPECSLKVLHKINFSIWNQMEKDINEKTLRKYLDFQKKQGHEIIFDPQRAADYLNSKGFRVDAETVKDVKMRDIPHQRVEKKDVRGVGLDIAGHDLANSFNERPEDFARYVANATRFDMNSIGRMGKGGFAYRYGGQPVLSRNMAADGIYIDLDEDLPYQLVLDRISGAQKPTPGPER